MALNRNKAFKHLYLFLSEELGAQEEFSDQDLLEITDKILDSLRKDEQYGYKYKEKQERQNYYTYDLYKAFTDRKVQEMIMVNEYLNDDDALDSEDSLAQLKKFDL